MWHSIGKITIVSAGSPVRITSARIACQTVFFQQIETNTGKLYVCDRANADKVTGGGILAIIPSPTLGDTLVATILPYVSVTIPTSVGALDASQFWVDADVDGDVCLVSYVRP